MGCIYSPVLPVLPRFVPSVVVSLGIIDSFPPSQSLVLFFHPIHSAFSVLIAFITLNTSSRTLQLVGSFGVRAFPHASG